jgi:hypothetical protein
VVAEFISLDGIDEVHENKPKYTRLIRLAPNPCRSARFSFDVLIDRARL